MNPVPFHFWWNLLWILLLFPSCMSSLELMVWNKCLFHILHRELAWVDSNGCSTQQKDLYRATLTCNWDWNFSTFSPPSGPALLSIERWVSTVAKQGTNYIPVMMTLSLISLWNNWSSVIVSLLNVKIKFKMVENNDLVAKMLSPNFIINGLQVSQPE